MIFSFPKAMNPTPEPFKPDPSLAEVWDNPAMTEFKRQEAEDRVAFGRSLEAREWLEHFRNSSPPDVEMRVVKPRKRFPFKPVRLPW
jgi:hypothetical protein